MKQRSLKIWMLLALFFCSANFAYSQVPDEPVKPPKPTLKVVPGDGQVLLYWDDVAESHYDEYLESIGLNPENFEGYKVYKSTDPNFIDALRITDNRGNLDRFSEEVQFDIINEIAGYHPKSINGTRFYLGSETGIQRQWIDTDVINGRTYYYAVVSYTHGDAQPNFEVPILVDNEGNVIERLPNEVYTIPPIESDIDITVQENGNVITGINTVQTMPKRASAGYVEPIVPTLTQVRGTGSGTINLDIIDPFELKGGNSYSITFEDTVVQRTSGPPDLVTKNFSLVNTTSGDTLFNRVENFEDVEFPVKEGLFLGITDVPERVVPDMERSGWTTSQTSSIHQLNLNVSRNNPRASDYEIEIFDGPVRESTPFQRGTANLPAEQVNIIVTNTTTGEEVDFAYLTNPQLPRDIRDVAYLSENNAIIAGAAGLIQRSTDGGENWEVIESGQSVRINSMSFVDDQNGWAVGRQGVIIRTSDGGSTWSAAQNTGTSVILRDVYFLNTSTGWAVGEGGTVLKTTNGGDTWQAKSSGTIRTLNGIYFLNENVGYASGFLTMLKTTDGGESWQALNTGATSNYQDLHFINEDTGWIVGTSGRIMETNDGGDTWQQVTSNTSSTLNAIHFADNTTGWAVGANGTIVHTNDGGATWSPQTSGVNAELFGFGILIENEVIAVGANSNRLRTIDAGSNWTRADDFRRFRAALDDNNQSRSDIIYILEEDEDGDLIDTWQISMLARTATSSVGLTVDPDGGDLLRFFTIKPFTSSDEFQFTIGEANLPSNDQSLIQDRLADIKVVPNPYLVTHLAEQSSNNGRERQLHFTNLPAECTIRIFSVSGRLLQTIDVNNSIDNDRHIWDMRTKSNDDLPYGVYIYHITAPGVGEKTGRFAVIK